MTDPNKRYIDPRTTVTGEQPRAIVPAGSGNPAPQPQSTPGAATTQSASSTGSAQQESVISQGSPTSSATTVKKTTAVPISSIIPDEFKGSSGQELVDFLEKKVREYKPLTEKDLKKIRRRQKAEGIISGISDAARALSNLIFTTRYAPNMYDPKESMSAKAKARFEKEEADRKAKDDEFFNYAMTLSNLRNAEKDRGLQAWRIEQTLARQDRDYLLNLGKNDAQVTKLLAEADAAAKRGDVYTADRLLKEAQKKKVETETLWIGPSKQAQIRRDNASANASNAMALSKAKHFDGKTYYSDEDYEKAVYEAARDYNGDHYKVIIHNDGKEEYVVPAPVQWEEKTDNGTKYHLHKASDVASIAEPLIQKNRKKQKGSNSGAGGAKTSDGRGAPAGGNGAGGNGQKYSNTSRIKW